MAVSEHSVLGDKPAQARNTDIAASHEAARIVNASRHKKFVLGALTIPRTHKQVFEVARLARFKATEQSLRSRLIGLVELGLVTALSTTRGEYGRRETVWALTSEGMEVVERLRDEIQELTRG